VRNQGLLHQSNEKEKGNIVARKTRNLSSSPIQVLQPLRKERRSKLAQKELRVLKLIHENHNVSTLYTFCSQNGCTDGTSPFGLVQGADGNFYGTTLQGGANNFGTVFKITPSGGLTTLYSFCSQSGCTEGSTPGMLVQATDGNLYGTTGEGGGNTKTCSGFINHCGTVFKITPSGALTTLYGFCPQSGCTDGFGPSGLVQATDGNFYGTTDDGGANICDVSLGSHGCGTVFKITPSGALTTLYSFFCSRSDCADGYLPNTALVQATDGNFYGTTQFGGIFGPCTGGCGTIYSLSLGLGPFVKTLPTSGKVGKTVGILGTNLSGATSVSFSGTAAAFKVVSSSLITTTVPADATSCRVRVVTPGGVLLSNVPFGVLP
jgi:uncharacterized repeat protein (TIGR03803 family)